MPCKLRRERILKGNCALPAGEIHNRCDPIVDARRRVVFPGVWIFLQAHRDQRCAETFLAAAMPDVGALYIELIRRG